MAVVVEAARQMNALSLSEEPMPSKLPYGTSGRPVDVVTNSWSITLKANIPFYKYDFRAVAVFVNKGVEGRKEITKQTRDDFMEQDRKAICVALFRQLVNLKKLPDSIYDRASSLFTIREIPSVTPAKPFVWTIKPAEDKFLSTVDSINEAVRVEVTITRGNDAQASTNDVHTLAEKRLEGEESSILEVLNLATSQGIFHDTDNFVVYGNGNAYLMNPESIGVQAKDISLTREKYLGVGMTKGVKVVEGEGGKGSRTALTIDVKKTAFHNDWQRLDEKMNELQGVQHNPQLLIGLKAVVHYANAPQSRKRVITIGGFAGTVRNTVLSVGDKKVSLADYVRKKYNTTLKNLDAKVVMDKHRADTLYSAECLLVAPNQRVTTDKAQKAVQEKVVRQCAVPPVTRSQQTQALSKSLQLDTPIVKAFGISVNPSPITTKGRVLGNVCLKTGGGVINVNNGKHDLSKVLRGPPAKMRYKVVGAAGANVDVERFASSLHSTATNLGISNIDRPAVEANVSDVEGMLLNAKAQGFNLVVFVSPGRSDNHAALKYYEMMHQIATQQVKAETVQKAGADTMKNIARKMNEKLGGQNVAVDCSMATKGVPLWFFEKSTLVVGITTFHPAQLAHADLEKGKQPSAPSIIAYSLNAVRGALNSSDENSHFSAGFALSQPREITEGEGTYEKVMLRTLESIMRQFKALRGTVPKKILVIRGGIPAGDFKKMRNEEVGMWRKVFTGFNPQYKPSLVVVTCNMTHSDRFYKSGPVTGTRAADQSLPPGTVIDRGVTDTAYNTFFLQSHIPLQGTASVPEYTIQSGEKATTMDELQNMMYALCCTHGISAMSTSVPTPLYVAQESMERAEMITSFYRSQKGGRFSLSQMLTDIMLNGENVLSGTRFNA